MVLYVDADGCPVKDEVYKVAFRYNLEVYVVSNTSVRVPPDELLHPVLVRGGFDAADDWIVQRAEAADIVVTADIPLAARCLEKGCRALDPRGRVFSPETIGDALATRELMSQLRDMGEVSGGPAPFSQRDRSRFLQRLDDLVQAVLKEARRSGPP